MDYTQVKSPEQIRMEMLVDNSGYILLRLFLFVMEIILVTVCIIAKILHLPALSAILWAWVKPTKFARKTGSVCRFISRNPVAMTMALSSLLSLPIVVGATLEQNGPEIAEFWVQTKMFLTPYLPIPSFLLGLLITYVILRLLPGYDDRCARINKNLCAPQSIVEFIENRPLPGSFPIMPSPTIMDDIRNLLSTKDKEIASLQNNLQSEDQELADLLADKEEAISKYQTTLQEKEKQILGLQGSKAKSTPQDASTMTRMSAFRDTSWGENIIIGGYQEEIRDARRSKDELEKKLASWVKKNEALKKELSDLQNARQKEAEKEKKVPKDWLKNSSALKNSIFRSYQERLVEYEAQISQRNSDLANAQQSINTLQSQLNQNQRHESAAAEELRASQEKVAGLEQHLAGATRLYNQYEECRIQYGKLEERRAAQVQAAQQEFGALQENFALAQGKIQEMEISQSRWELRGARAEARFHDREREFADLQARARKLQFEVDSHSRQPSGFIAAAPNQQRHNAALQGLRDKRDEFARERDTARLERDAARLGRDNACEERSEALSRETETDAKLETAEELIAKLEKEREDQAALIHSLEARMMVADVRLEQQRGAGPPPSAPASPRKRGRGKGVEEGGREEDAGREKRHQDKPAWRAGGEDDGGVFSEGEDQ